MDSLSFISRGMSSSLSFLYFSPFSLHHRSVTSIPSTTLRLFPALSRNPLTNACLSPVNPGDFHMEEGGWLREEQRWLREEERWLREEKRWNNERECLLREISELRLKIQASECQDCVQGVSLSETLEKVTRLLQNLKDGNFEKFNLISETGSGPKPIVLETDGIQEVGDVRITKVVDASDGKTRAENMLTNITKVSLRKGSEGEDVQTMQEALQNLGFYSGEEDMEFSTFASGTERAVMTWQATIGSPEDGIMTTNLLEKLYMGQTSSEPSRKDGSSKMLGARESVEVVDFNAPRQRIFLLGENRWEEEASNFSGDNGTKCVSCRGEGRLLCMECDGTGEPNIEPQFLEWVDENLKCPYCNGDGYTICDVCNEKK